MIDPSKTEAILKMEAPKDLQGVQRLAGTVNYLAKFLPHLSDVMEPIRQLVNKNVEWEWGCEQEEAFEHVKALVTEAPML